MIKKVFSMVMIIALIFTFFCVSTKVQAVSISNIIGGAGNFINEGTQDANNTINMEKLRDTSNLIYNLLLIVGTVAAVIVATIMGIKFITGSVEQKVKIKESVIPFVVGCIVLFGAFGIWKLVITLIR